MRQDNHPDYILAAKAKVSIYWGARAVAEGAPDSWKDDDAGRLGALIVIAPHDSEFKTFLEGAGVHVDTNEAEPDLLYEPPPDHPLTLDELLQDLNSHTTKEPKG
jgi:hypothetical protein